MVPVQVEGYIKAAKYIETGWKCGSKLENFQTAISAICSVVGVDRQADERKIAILLTVTGTEGTDVFNTFVFVQRERQV